MKKKKKGHSHCWCVWLGLDFVEENLTLRKENTTLDFVVFHRRSSNLSYWVCIFCVHYNFINYVDIFTTKTSTCSWRKSMKAQAKWQEIKKLLMLSLSSHVYHVSEDNVCCKSLWKPLWSIGFSNRIDSLQCTWLGVTFCYPLKSMLTLLYSSTIWIEPHHVNVLIFISNIWLLFTVPLSYVTWSWVVWYQFICTNLD